MSVNRTMTTVNGNRKRNTGLVKLFVGQIPSTMDETALCAFLSDYVPILRVEILYNHKSNLHRSVFLVLGVNYVDCAFAFVESDDDAKTLIQSLNGQFTFDEVEFFFTVAIWRRCGSLFTSTMHIEEEEMGIPIDSLDAPLLQSWRIEDPKRDRQERTVPVRLVTKCRILTLCHHL